MLRRQLAPNVLEHLLKALRLEALRASAAAALCNLASEPSVTWLILNMAFLAFLVLGSLKNDLKII